VSWAGSEVAQVYLGRQTAGVVDPLATASAGTVWMAGDSVEDCWRRAIESLVPKKWRKRRIDLVLSGALARPFMMAPVAGLRSWREAEQVAASLAPDATGLMGPCEVWLGDWSPNRPSLVVAIDIGVRQLIEATARELGVRLAGLRPWWATALRQASQQTPATRLLAAEDTDALTVLTGENEGFGSATTYAPCPHPDQIGALFARLGLASGVEPDRAVRATLLTSETVEAAAPFAAHWGLAA